MAFERLIEIADDLLNLEVATMTSSEGISLEPEVTPEEEAQLTAGVETLKTARQSLTQAISDAGGDSTPAVKAAKKELKSATQALVALQDSIGIFDPRNTFARILAKLGKTPKVELVAYSRFEIEGDSVSYISRDDANQDLVASHGKLVEASQQSRKALFEFVKDIVG